MQVRGLTGQVTRQPQRASFALPESNESDTVRLILQSDHQSDLDRLRAGFFNVTASRNRIHAELPIVHGLAVEVATRNMAALLDEIGQCQNVRASFDAPVTIPVIDEPDPVPQLDLGVPVTRAPELWQRGLTGKGVNIAVLDTGIAPHTDVKSRVVAFHDVLHNQSEMYDDNGHGTHVSGIAAGDGTASQHLFKGAAPEAGLVGIKVLDQKGEGRFSDIIKGVQWAVENKDRLNIKVLNLSLGGTASKPYAEDPLAQALDAAWQAGLFPVVAAGNEGPFTRTITTPGHALNVMTVGASDDRATPDISDDKIGSFSSRGPTRPDGLTKPDIVAPGVRITSADAFSDGYSTKSGTSMSTPMIAGIAALLLQANPQATPEQLKSAMMASARPLAQGGEPTVQGSGLVDAVAALDQLTRPPALAGSATLR